MGTPGKFLKTGIFAGISLRKFPWLLSIDFNATMLAPAYWGEPCTFCFSGLWDFLLGVQVKESSCEWLQIAMLLGRLWEGAEMARFESCEFDWLELGKKKIERSVAAVAVRWKKIVACHLSRLLKSTIWWESPKRSCRETDGQLRGSAGLPEESANSGCLPNLVNQTETISVLLHKFMVCQYLKHYAVLIR